MYVFPYLKYHMDIWPSGRVHEQKYHHNPIFILNLRLEYSFAYCNCCMHFS